MRRTRRFPFRRRASRASGIFANGPHESVVGNPAGDLGPGVAVVVGLIDIRKELVPLVPINSYVGGAGIERRSIDLADAAPFRHLLGSDIGPALTVVARDMD